MQKSHFPPEIHFAEEFHTQPAAEQAVPCGTPCQAAAGAGFPKERHSRNWGEPSRGDSFPSHGYMDTAGREGDGNKVH